VGFDADRAASDPGFVLHSFDPPRGAPSLTRDDPTAFAPPPAFGPFRVLHQIGVGALGPVFRTYEPTRDRLVAVKVFRLDITPEQAQALADELSRAADAGLFHPSIVEPVAAGIEGTVAYRAEEYVAAESLDVAMRHYAPAPLEKALPFITQLAGAIDFARAAGVGHGALHPRDIFVTPDEARATGFGVVEALERVGLRAPIRRPYSAPERIAGEAWSTPADVFALAAIAYELLTGRRPSGTGDRIGALAGADFDEDARLHGVHAVLARAMQESPAKRFPTALAFAAALEAAARAGQGEPAVAATAAAAAAAGASAVPDDVADEREEDEAHYALSRRELEEAEPEASLVDEEAEADYALVEAEPERFADEFVVEGAEDADVGSAAPAIAALDDEIREADPDAEEEALAQDPRVFAAAQEEIRDDPRLATAAGDVLQHDRTSLTSYSGGGGQEYAAGDERSRRAMLPLAVTLIVGLLIGFAAGYAVGGRGDAAPGAAGTADQAPPLASATPDPGKAYSEQVVAQPPTPPPAIPQDAPPPDERRAATAPPSPAAPGTGRIVVESTPAGAAVTVNGKWIGRTPLTLNDVRFGPYTVRVVQPGFDVAREEFTLSAAAASRTVAVRLTKQGPPSPRGGAPAPAAPPAGAGSLYLDSRPRGARVVLDGKPIGTTPMRIPEVAAGSHVVRLELADHQTWTTSTRIAGGQETRVTGSLERIR
jgi:serine/threonine-protein kinase